ncbi:MAG: hypothetical protein ABIN58_01255, partial [candidate division WOR-3 bacterium]
GRVFIIESIIVIPTMLNMRQDKGQVALEYLLIVVVSLIVVVGVMNFMQTTTTSTKSGASCAVDSLLCKANRCATASDCPAICGTSGKACTNGYCVPGTCASAGPASCEFCEGDTVPLASRSCNTFPGNPGYTGGTLGCTPDCLQYDESGCYWEYSKSSTLYQMEGYIKNGGYNVNPGDPDGDIIYILSSSETSRCGGSFADCIGRRLDILSASVSPGSNAITGSYSVTGVLHNNVPPYPVFSSAAYVELSDKDDLVLPPDLSRRGSVTFRLYGPSP